MASTTDFVPARVDQGWLVFVSGTKGYAKTPVKTRSDRKPSNEELSGGNKSTMMG